MKSSTRVLLHLQVEVFIGGGWVRGLVYKILRWKIDVNEDRTHA